MAVAVPPLVQPGIAKTEVAADVDDRPTLVEPGARLLRGFPRRQRSENGLRVADLLADDERVRRGVQVRLHGTERLTLVGARNRGDQLGLGVTQDEPGELTARVARDANDRDPGWHGHWIM